MTKKLLAVLGVCAVAAYLFRDRIAAGALLLAEKFNSLADDPSEDSWEVKEEQR